MNSVICPTVTAFSADEYKTQITKLGPFAKRVHIDLMDGEFAPTLSPSLDQIWWPPNFLIDIHLMYQRPMDHLEQLIRMQPHMVVVHVESMFHHMHFAAELHKENIKTGLAIMPDTPIANVEQILNSFDHLLIFSGDLGHFGGQADLELLNKVQEAKAHHPDLEFGWDGGISVANAKQLAEGGIDVLNVGGFIQNSENPKQAFGRLVDSLS